MKLIDLVNSVIIFLSQTTSFYLLLRLLTFLLRSQDCDSHNRGLLDLLIYSHASICSTMVFSLGNSDVFISISIDFLSNWKWDSPFHCIDYSCADWDGLYDHLRDITWEEIFKLSASELPVNSVGGFRTELMCVLCNMVSGLLRSGTCGFLLVLIWYQKRKKTHSTLRDQ